MPTSYPTYPAASSQFKGALGSYPSGVGIYPRRARPTPGLRALTQAGTVRAPRYSSPQATLIATQGPQELLPCARADHRGKEDQ
jgi:hypothetical protein